MSQASNQSGRAALEREINDKMVIAHSLGGAVKEVYLLDVVFPLLDQANKAGYSVEFHEKSGRYYLEEVGERWTRITHSTRSS